MGNNTETKSETFVSSDEEKQEVGQGEEGILQAPDQQNLLEVSCRRRYQVARRSCLLILIAFHQPSRGCQFRGHLPVRMGDCWRHLPILSPEWWPGFNGVWRHPGLFRRQCHCHVARRDGLNVRILNCCAKTGIAQPRLVIPSSAHSTAGQHTLLQRVPDSGVCYKVPAHRHKCFDDGNDLTI
jgi:hypothetical protein